MNERVLNILEFPKIREAVVEQCITPYGQQLAEQLEPLRALSDVADALALTSEGYAVYRLKGAPPFPRTMDVRSPIIRAQKGGILSASELVAIALTARASRYVSRFLEDVAQRVELPRFLDMVPTLAVPRTVEQDVLFCIDEDAVILDQASPELSSIRREMRLIQERMKRTLEEMLHSPTVQRYLQDTIITMRKDRYCLAVKAENQSQVRGVVHDESASGATVYVEPERVFRLGNELTKLRGNEEREIERILQRLSSLVMGHADVLQEAIRSLGILDFAIAKAIYAKKEQGVEPRIVEQSRLHIRAGRHPLLAKDRVVPLDVRIGDDFHLLVITGPNTGGKTVALKTMGLLTIMALSGLYVPAAEGTEIGFFTEVFADIGDEQSIEQSLSTFSSHMKNIVHILGEADDQSLVLFDELGAGTDPTEGAALAMAILDTLRLRHVCALATTHYSELKAYAYTTPDTMNASVEFDLATLAPTYRLLVGVPGRSNAFAIARRLGLQADLIESAQEKLSTNDIRVEDLIAQLQHSVIVSRDEEKLARDLRLQAEALENKWREMLQKEEQERDRKRARADDELRQYIKRAQREADMLLQELRELRAEGIKLKDHELADARGRLERLSPGQSLHIAPKSIAKKEIRVGDEVRVLTLSGQKATVMEISGDEALVAVGAMKMKVSNANLELLKAREKVATPTTLFTRTSETVMASLDIRGETIEEAILAVDRYLDRAILAGFHQVTLIHGKGTGALRHGLQDYLRAHPRIKSMRPGGQGEGGSGVTVVEFS